MTEALNARLAQWGVIVSTSRDEHVLPVNQSAQRLEKRSDLTIVINQYRLNAVAFEVAYQELLAPALVLMIGLNFSPPLGLWQSPHEAVVLAQVLIHEPAHSS